MSIWKQAALVSLACALAWPANAQILEEDPQADAAERADRMMQVGDVTLDPPAAVEQRFYFGPARSARLLETRIGEVELELSTGLDLYTMNNQDFRELNEDTEFDIEFSDDRHTFGLVSTRFGVAIRPIEQIEFRMRLGSDAAFGSNFVGLQGNDRDPEFLSTLSLREMNLRYTVFDNGSQSLSVRAGRQIFNIGGVGRDYVLDDILDAITFDLQLGESIGRVRGLIFDLYAGSDLPENVYFVGYQADRTAPRGFRGKNNTYRTGLVYESGDWVDGLDLRAYYFFAKIGANCQGAYNTGTDISFCGQLGNFSDNDYVQIFGLRGSYTLNFGEEGDESASSLRIYGEVSQSLGVDRKEATVRDVSADGIMAGGGLEGNWDLGNLSLRGRATGYYFQGPDYASDGLQFEHGYVGFRGARVGGLAIGGISGWRPSAYLSAFGINDRPHDTVRSSGTTFLNAGVGLGIGDTSIDIDFWHYRDSGSTFVEDFPVPTDFDLPQGYSREEVAAQERMGEVLGNEINLRVGQALYDMVDLYLEGGVFLPGDFYGIETRRLVGSALGGDQAYWAIRLGTYFQL